MTPDDEKYQKWCLARIAKGHSIVLRKAVCRAVPAVKQQIPGVTSKVLLGKTAQNAMGCGELALEQALMRLQKAGVIICTNGIWWKP
jgi:hypothetical protein